MRALQQLERSPLARRVRNTQRQAPVCVAGILATAAAGRVSRSIAQAMAGLTKKEQGEAIALLRRLGKSAAEQLSSEAQGA